MYESRIDGAIPVLTGRALASRALPAGVATWVEHRGNLELAQHRHAEAVIALLLHGTYDERVDGRMVHPTPATVLVKPPETPHANAIGRAGTHTVLWQIAPDAIDGELRPFLQRPAIYLDARVCRVTDALRRELSQRDDAAPLATEALLFELLAIVQECHAGKGYNASGQWLNRVRERLHDASETPSLSALAREADVHRAHLARGFRNAFGCTIGEYWRSVRLQRLAERLRANHGNIASCAAEMGFYDQAHLTRWFRRAYGVTPGEYARRAW